MDHRRLQNVERDALHAWRRLNNPVLDPSGVEVLQFKKKKACVFRLAQTGQRAHVVAKRCRTREALREQAALTIYLPRLGVPTLKFWGLRPAAAPGYSWIFSEDANGRPLDNASRQDQLLAANWLGEMHAAAAGCGNSPVLRDLRASFFLNRLHHVIRVIQQHGASCALGREDHRLLDVLLAQCHLVAGRWRSIVAICREFPDTLVHGSFSHRNVRVRDQITRRALMVFDWGAAGWGSPARDLARMSDLAGYQRAMSTHLHGLTLDSTKELAAVGTLFRAIEHMGWYVDGLPHENWIERSMGVLRQHCATLEKWAS